MGNASCQYPSGVSRAARQSWNHTDREPRIFTPWDSKDCPGIDLYDGLVLPKKAVRFLLGDPDQIPEHIPTSPKHKRSHSIDPAQLKSILKHSSIIIKQPPKRRHRRIRSLTRRISNSKVEVIPYYFTKRGIPAADQIPVKAYQPSTEADESKLETARRPSIDLVDSETPKPQAQDADTLRDSLESFSSDRIELEEHAEFLLSELNLQKLKQECALNEKLVLHREDSYC